MTQKKFTTYTEQILLLTKRGVAINSDSDKAFATEVLQTLGYYNLINGYKAPFIDNHNTDNEIYKAGTSIQEIYALYEFDRILSEIFMSFLLKVETKAKSLISYYFSEIYGHDNYLLYNNFNKDVHNANIHIPELIAEINRQIASRTKDPSISHYLIEYGYTPLWVLNNILTFGTISKFYSLMNIKEKTKVSKEFGVQPHDMENFLLYLSAVRNFCAHGNRLFCYRSGKRLLNDTEYHSKLNIPKKQGQYTLGKCDLFAAVIALKKLLSNDDYQKLKEKLEHSMDTVSKEIKTLHKDEILTEMGFPSNWTEL